jgi:hypothetical protein
MRQCLILIFFLTNLLSCCYGQEFDYFLQIRNIVKKEKLATSLFQKLDSAKRTRRPIDSKIEIYFNRDVDFGYKHQRINLQLNGNFYTINLLIKNDTVYYSSIVRDFTIRNNVTTDTLYCLAYLKLRNKFYGSAKTLNDLKTEINLDGIYAVRCGDGFQKTTEWLNIESLVKHKNIGAIKNLLQNICCEEQEYGVSGLALLKKEGVKFPKSDKHLAEYIKQRKSILVECHGCFTSTY